MTKLPLSWFEGTNVVEIARLLIGKIIRTDFDGKLTSGRISETEAYAGVSDKASHAFGGRRTARTETMYANGGTAYVYLCYGIHHLFNIVTNVKDVPHAVLIRGILPLEGEEQIRQRLNKPNPIPSGKLATGPGLVSKALGISTLHTGILLENTITIWEDGFHPERIEITPRIGIDYAKEDKDLPYRFLLV
ncbi:DNA-3-methyladenine glycosylase [Flavihumibacter sp. UBA7668]|uniref:DNA-3-methyladenine glycosylase n=1 Tax=Flavihumibacter sp. UBA7668 TaxID=1946542 RepID=UPI0025BD5765|nr:DNA-3-methyladenine glycosylase [Flavihumibacter sp. UBA7668]